MSATRKDQTVQPSNKSKTRTRRRKKSEPRYGGSSSSIDRNKTKLVRKKQENAFIRELHELVSNCSICKDKICNDRFTIFTLPCGHGFGDLCIDAWIYLHERCPTCYTKVDHKMVFQQTFRQFKGTQNYTRALWNAKEKIGISGTIAGSFVAGGEAASSFLEGAAIVASEMITEGANQGMQKNLVERDIIQPRMSAAERQQLKKRMATAKFVAGATATVTGCVSNVVGTSLWALGSLVTPLIKRGTRRLLTDYGNVGKDKANDVVEGALALAKGAILSTGQILRGLEHATAVVASSAASNAARMYEFSRGLEPGELESDVEDIARNFVETAWNIRSLPPKSFTTISRTVQPPYKPPPSSAIVRYGGFEL